MTREEVKIEFTGLAHDHMMVNKGDIRTQSTPSITATSSTAITNSPSYHNSHLYQDSRNNAASNLSTIAILRRHPMYDSLVLVKRFRACLNGYTLEFPTSDVGIDRQQNQSRDQQQHQPQHHQKDCCKTKLVSVYLDGDDPIYQCKENKCRNGLSSNEGEIVYVPMNGLMDRLDTYDRQGVSIDSRVYAFAMGLKTAEKFLTNSSMKEVQETPPI